MLEKLQNLKIVFVTDIHLHAPGLAKLEEWANIYHNSESKFDYCLIGGDTANCNHQTQTHDEKQMWMKTNEVHRKIKQIFGCKAFFVPGNHDCVRFYKGYEGEGATNLHNRRIQLAEGLQLIGFGGSLPAYVEGKLHWTGYPYHSEADLEKQWDRREENFAIPNSQFLFLSHVGPSESQTTLDRSQYPQVIKTGSTYLQKFLKNQNMLAWFHGHTHQGSHCCRISKTQIINPGALRHLRFMHLELSKVQGVWAISKKTFQNLI